MIGDGSFTNGMILPKALNGCARPGLRLMIVLNDNEIVDLEKRRRAVRLFYENPRQPELFRVQARGEGAVFPHPLVGRFLIRGAVAVKEFIKRVTK